MQNGVEDEIGVEYVDGEGDEYYEDGDEYDDDQDADDDDLEGDVEESECCCISCFETVQSLL